MRRSEYGAWRTATRVPPRLVCCSEKVEANTSNLTRDWYTRTYRQRLNNDELWDLTQAEAASDWFDEFCDAAGSPCVSRGLIERDRTQLKEGVDPVVHFANKRIAHHNPDFDPTLTYGEISAAVDVIHDLFHRYVRLIRMVAPYEPTDVTNWGAAFSVAWRPAPSA